MAEQEPPGVDASHFDKSLRATRTEGDDFCWYDSDEPRLEISGFCWREQDQIYRRMPLTPPQPLPQAVDALANHCAGGQIRLRSNSRRLAVQVELAGPANMRHMPATGQCGFDMYVGPLGAERFVGVSMFDHTQTSYEVQLYSQPECEWRDLTLNFPLYQGVRKVLVGLDRDAALEAAAARTGRIVFYGTSITQGGCASRPGMAYPAILSRRLQLSCINLGFSGNGKGESQVAESIACIDDCSLFVLDYDTNCPDAEHLARTLPVFIDILRRRHSEIQILVVSKPPNASEARIAATIETRQRRADAQRSVVERYRKDGDAALHFLDGGALLGGEDFHECTVDGTHPTDLGFLRMADGLEPVIRRVLAQDLKSQNAKSRP